MSNKNQTKKELGSSTKETSESSSQSLAWRSGRRLKLIFINGERPELDRVEFKFNESSGTTYCQRGDEQCPLNWSRVAEAMSLCFLGYICWELKKSGDPYFFRGDCNGSLAASLGDATYQQDHALHNLFADVILQPNSKSFLKSKRSIVNSLFGGYNRGGKNKSKRIPKRERNVNDSILALVSLGYRRTEAKLAVLAVREAHPRASVEKLVKGGLMRLKKGP